MSLGSVLNQAGAGSYTRDQILTDATKTAYGLTEAATPDDVFNLLQPRYSTSGVLAGAYIGDGVSSRTLLGDVALIAVIVWELYGSVNKTSGNGIYSTADYYWGFAVKNYPYKGIYTNTNLIDVGNKGFIVKQGRFMSSSNNRDNSNFNNDGIPYGYIAVVAS